MFYTHHKGGYMKYDLKSNKLIEYNDNDIINLLNFGYENHPEFLPRYSQYNRRNMMTFQKCLDNLAYLFFKEKLKAI